MTKKLSLLLFLFLSFWAAWGQSEASENALFLQKLKSSALLVRLPEQRLALKALRERGDSNAVAELLREQERNHREILLSFTHTFDFCPVYFFLSRHSASVRQGQLSGILIDAAGEKISDAHLPDHFYTAEFGQTPLLQIEAFVVMDQRLLALSEPLPFYERKFAWFGLKRRSKAEMLARYNKRLWKLWSYYQSAED